jgi:DNA-binding beta-propeller fold protein YncE
MPIIGIEWDGRMDNGLTPVGLEIVADSPAISQDGRPWPHVNASVYYPTPHSLVFGAGSINWITGLAGDNADPRAQRMLENVFAHAGFKLVQPMRVETRALAEVGPSTDFRVLAGSGEAGYRDGEAATARLSSPAGIGANGAGEIYIADTGNGLVRKLDVEGVVTTIAGCPEAVMRDGEELCLDNPVGVAVNSRGEVFVSDTGHNRIIRIDTGGHAAVYAGTGGPGGADSADLATALFSNPRGLAIGPDDSLYVADFGNGAIRRIDAMGVNTVARKIPEITGVAVGPDGTIHFASMDTVTLGRIRDGVIERVTETRVHPLEGLAVDARGVVFADASTYRVRRVREDRSVATLAGDGRAGPMPGRISLPRGVAAVGGGYAVADSGNHRIVWFRDSAAP